MKLARQGEMAKTQLKKATSIRGVDFAVRMVVTVLISIVVPVLLGTVFESKFPLDSQVLLGLALALVGLVTQLLPLALAVRDAQIDLVNLQDARGEGGEMLANVRKSYDDLLLAGNTLFAAYFRREIRRLEGQVHQAASKFELYVDQDSDTTEMMLLPFDGRSSGVIGFVHHVEDNSFLLDVHARHFFIAIVEGVRSGKIASVRRLLVYNDPEDLDSDDSQRIMAFHRSEKNFDYRVIQRNDFERMARDSHLPSGKLDFGLYGPWYIFRSLEANSDEVSGVFLSGSRELEIYRAFFERCWRSPIAQQVDAHRYASMPLDELFRRRPAPVAQDSRIVFDSEFESEQSTDV